MANKTSDLLPFNPENSRRSYRFIDSLFVSLMDEVEITKSPRTLNPKEH